MDIRVDCISTLCQKVGQITSCSYQQVQPNNALLEHDPASKKTARDVVDQLLTCKAAGRGRSESGDIACPLAKIIMHRYQFDDEEQLNQWLDQLM